MGLLVLTFWAIGYGPMLLAGFAFAIAVAPGKATQKSIGVRTAISFVILGITLCSPFILRSQNEKFSKTPPRHSVALLKNVCKQKAVNEVYATIDSVESIGIFNPYHIDEYSPSAPRPAYEPRTIGVPFHHFDEHESTWINRPDGRPGYRSAFAIATVIHPNETVKVRGLLYLSKDFKLPLSGGIVPKGTEVPRYQLVWKNVQTSEEDRAWIIGVETTILDALENRLLAKRITYYLREEFGASSFGTKMIDACDDAIVQRNGGANELKFDSYDWVASIVKPKT